jgi:hypothetical protein
MIWIELRCERRSEGDNRCLSDDNEGPMRGALDSVKDATATLRSIEFDAKQSGWKKVRGEGWVRPNCLAP